MSVQKMEAICHGLEHNFFADLAQQLPIAYTHSVAHDTALEKGVVELENELQLITAERDILFKAVKMG